MKGVFLALALGGVLGAGVEAAETDLNSFHERFVAYSCTSNVLGPHLDEIKSNGGSVVVWGIVPLIKDRYCSPDKAMRDVSLFVDSNVDALTREEEEQVGLFLDSIATELSSSYSSSGSNGSGGSEGEGSAGGSE
jgi:hypothetical protein